MRFGKRMRRAAAVLACAVILPAMSAGADSAGKPEDGEILVQLDFEDGGTDGLTTYTNGGSCEIGNSGGRLAVSITDCGQLDYANQVYYDGFALHMGCVYTYSFDVSSDIGRKMEYRIQLNGGDYHAYMSDRIDIGPETRHIEADWTMEEDSDPAPRIVFNLGRMEDTGEDPGAHTVLLDNICLQVKDASGAQVLEGLPEYPPLTLSQVGYRSEDRKTVFVKGDGEEGEQTFRIVDDAGNVRFEAELAPAAYDRASDERIRSGDFSDLREEGSYRVRITEGGEEIESYPFVIGDNVYGELFRSSVRMLYMQRCGSATDASYAGAFAHGACHTGEAVIFGTDRTKDVSGGWHDAGDYGRYTVAGAKAVADLFLAFEEFGADMDDIGIPESGNGVPDLLDEARYELEFLLKMQDEESGMVYHKVTGYAFPGVVPPEGETEQLVLAPVSTAATGDFAAVMAKASRLYAPFDETFAKQAEEAAIAAYEAIRDTEDTEGFTNPPEISTGEYPDRMTKDERFFAAAELYLAGHTEYAEDLRALYTSNMRAGLGWASATGYAFYDLAANAPEGADELAAEVRARILADADALVTKSGKDRYYMSLEKQYPWGSNMTVADNGLMLLFAERLGGDPACGELAKRNLDYLTGANSLGYCFITGFGSMSPEHTHHRPSQYAGSTMPGMLVGGPDSNLEDPYARGVLRDEAPAKCYVDSEQSFSTNEVTIYWNAPLVALLAAFLN